MRVNSLRERTHTPLAVATKRCPTKNVHQRPRLATVAVCVLVKDVLNAIKVRLFDDWTKEFLVPQELPDQRRTTENAADCIRRPSGVSFDGWNTFSIELASDGVETASPEKHLHHLFNRLR